MQIYDTVIVGGGAAGLTAAVLLGQMGERLSRRYSILILEKQARVGKKLLATGNGTCNITNMAATPDRYHGNRALAKAVVHRFSPPDTIAFFNHIGVNCVQHADGKVYPRAAQASAVLDQLRREAAVYGVEERCDSKVTAIQKSKNGFTITTATDTIHAKTVLVCTGGAAAPALGGDTDGYGLLTALGHNRRPLFPSIVQVKTDTTYVRAMKGLRIDGKVTLTSPTESRSDTGEILFTEYGLSGPAVMQVSRVAGSWERQKRGECTAFLDLLPDMPINDLITILSVRRSLKQRTLEGYLTGFLNKRIGQTVLRAAGHTLTAPADSLSDADVKALAQLMKNWAFPVVGTKGFAGAQVTAGGIDGAEFNPDTMESRFIKGIFAAGEVLDVDGDCGGMNLQFAFSSAAVAVHGIIERLKGSGTP